MVEGRVGTIISENININETVIQEDEKESIQLKNGIAPGTYNIGTLSIDTTLLHNTHSWAVIAINTE